MRLESLVVEKYGNFEREVVRLDATPGRLNLVVAPNGAGKSVLRQAFADLLYGIGGQSRMGFRYGYPGMRLTAELRDGSGGTVRLVRRKGHGGTLLDGEGRDGGALLAGMLGGTDVRRLQQLFSLDTERLRVGGRELLESGGDLAEALLAAGSGLRRARELERGFAEARDALAPERKAAGKPFYQGVEALLEARKSGRAETLTVEAWEEARRGVAEAAEALRLAEAEVAACGAEASRLGRIRATRPLLRQHGEAAGWLAAHGEAPVLGEGWGRRWRRRGRGDAGAGEGGARRRRCWSGTRRRWRRFCRTWVCWGRRRRSRRWCARRRRSGRSRGICRRWRESWRRRSGGWRG